MTVSFYTFASRLIHNTTRIVINGTRDCFTDTGKLLKNLISDLKSSSELWPKSSRKWNKRPGCGMEYVFLLNGTFQPLY